VDCQRPRRLSCGPPASITASSLSYVIASNHFTVESFDFRRGAEFSGPLRWATGSRSGNGWQRFKAAGVLKERGCCSAALHPRSLLLLRRRVQTG